MAFVLAIGAVAAFGIAAAWFHGLDRSCRRSAQKRREVERSLAAFMMTLERARGQTRAYRAMACAFDCFFAFALARFLTPIYPGADDLLTFVGGGFLFLAMVFVVAAEAIINFNSPKWFVQAERRQEVGVKQIHG